MAGGWVIGVIGCFEPLDVADVRLEPSSLQAIGSTTVTATPGEAKTGLGVVIRDQHQVAMPNVTVAFTAEGGQVSPATTMTDASGQAYIGTWTLPTVLGVARLRAAVPSKPSIPAAVFTATVTVGPAAKVGVVSGVPTTQSAVAGAAVGVPPAVLVTDAWDNPVPNILVTFSVTAGGGQLTGASQTTNANGVATVGSWTLGPSIGTNTMTASVSGSNIVGNPVTFTANGTAGPPAQITIAPGAADAQDQTAIAGTNVPIAPAVLVRDANGNASVGTVMVFQITTGGGKVLSSATDTHDSFEVTTNSNGIAAIHGWRLGAVGANRLTVSVKNNSSVSLAFDATGTVGPPAEISATNAPWEYVRQGTNVGGTPRVVVRDVGGNVIGGQSVVWTAVGAGSSVSGTTTSTTTTAGIASFTGTWSATGTVNTDVTLRATVSGTDPALTRDFTSRIVGSQANAIVAAGNNQSAPANTDLPVRPAVRVRDANNNPVPGVSVTFAVTGGGGSLTGATQTTDSVGVATVGNWRLGSTIGTQTMSATPSGLVAVAFSATATVGEPASISVNSGNNQTTSVNNTVTISIIVRDAAGNAVPNANVRFTPQGSTNAAVTGMSPAGTISAGVGTTTTNSTGVASATWRLDTLSGTNTLAASVVNTTLSVNFTATGNPLAASKMVIDAGNNQSATVSTAVSVPPRVKVTDVYNNPVSAIVNFTHHSGPATSTVGSSSPTSSSTTGLAQTSWTMGSVAGTYQLRAALNINTAVNVTFTATAEPAGPTCNDRTVSLTSTANYTGTFSTGDCTINDSYVHGMFAEIGSGLQRSFRASLRRTSGTFIPRMLLRVYPPTETGWTLTGNAESDSAHFYFILGASPTGTPHKIFATTSTTGHAGSSYTFRIEPNPSITTRCTFIVSPNISGVVHPMNDSCGTYTSTAPGRTGTRWYKVYYVFVPEGKTLTASVTNSTSFTPIVEAYLNSDNSYVTPSGSSSTASSAQISVDGGTGGRFIYIVVSHATAGTATGNYTLAITQTP